MTSFGSVPPLLLVAVLFTAGCNSAAQESPAAKPTGKPHETGIVTLTAEEIRSGAIVVEPATRGEFKLHRDFPATVVPDSHATADITALVRGRVLDVYAVVVSQSHRKALRCGTGVRACDDAAQGKGDRACRGPAASG